MNDKPGKKITPALDALELLKADHDKVRGLFREFEDLKDIDDEDGRKGRLVDEICREVATHTMIEDEIFYPLLRSVIDDDDLMDEAGIEHAGARELIGQLETMFPGDDHYDATVTVLGEEIAHHIEKEECDMFDAARNAGLDLDELGAQLATRKEELDDGLPAQDIPAEAVAPRGSARQAQRPPN
ncbi:hemerythrin domain-containing protein [Massilia cavernae]|uniref:Hemerythrin domain-containing protein n=1 Tax=Massilia cavernae TaxID=2320864 RepID=A0A418X6Z3_9BURK|nr:hemerythrin domain-containing protein [Massilia cavernae]RJG08232.1 hemerythrin domain-containing protein [Massilia cavernae]